VLARLAMALPGGLAPTEEAAAATTDALLAPLGLRRFLAEHWERSPVHLPAPHPTEPTEPTDTTEATDGSRHRGRFDALLCGLLGANSSVEAAEALVRGRCTCPLVVAAQLDPVAAVAQLVADPAAHFGGRARHGVDVRLVRCVPVVRRGTDPHAATKKVANRNARAFGWEIAHEAVSRRPPSSPRHDWYSHVPRKSALLP
jgi:hypothetical protein